MLTKQRFAFLVFFCLSLNGYGQVLQVGWETAVFGLDADVYANGLQFGVNQTNNSNSHDWFYNPLINSGTGVGVIDQSQTNIYLPQLQAENNISFTIDLAFPQNTLIDGIRIMDGIYARDYYTSEYL